MHDGPYPVKTESEPSDPNGYMNELYDKLPKSMQSFCDQCGSCTLEDVQNMQNYLSELAHKMRQHASETITVDDFERAKEH